MWACRDGGREKPGRSATLPVYGSERKDGNRPVTPSGAWPGARVKPPRLWGANYPHNVFDSRG